MATDLPDIIAAIQDKVGALTGIKAAPDEPPEVMNQFPFSACYPASGTYRGQSAGWMKELHTIVLELHFNRSILPRAFSLALPYGRLVAKAILGDPALASTVDTTNGIEYKFGELRWGAEKELHIGWQFMINVKVEPSL